MAEANGNRPRGEVPGLEGFDELRSQLRGAKAEAAALATANQQLGARVAMLERRLAEAAALRDDELMAELPVRMRRALESAQEVSEELIARAQTREETIRARTEQRATALMARAEREATAMMRRAAAEAVGRIDDAKARAEALVVTAQARHDQVMADLQQQRAVMEHRLRAFRQQHQRLVEAYDVAEVTLGTARGALRAAAEAAGTLPPAAAPIPNGIGHAHDSPSAMRSSA